MEWPALPSSRAVAKPIPELQPVTSTQDMIVCSSESVNFALVGRLYINAGERKQSKCPFRTLSNASLIECCCGHRTESRPFFRGIFASPRAQLCRRPGRHCPNGPACGTYRCRVL